MAGGGQVLGRSRAPLGKVLARGGHVLSRIQAGRGQQPGRFRQVHGRSSRAEGAGRWDEIRDTDLYSLNFFREADRSAQREAVRGADAPSGAATRRPVNSTVNDRSYGAPSHARAEAVDTPIDARQALPQPREGICRIGAAFGDPDDLTMGKNTQIIANRNAPVNRPKWSGWRKALQVADAQALGRRVL